MPWNPWNTFASGNFYPENGVATDALVVAAAAAMFDVGAQVDSNNSFPGMSDGGTEVESLPVTQFTTRTRFDGTQTWADDGPDHLEVHFTTAAARDAYAVALAGAATPLAHAAVVQNYRDHAVGGYWGSMGTAL